ncbi:MFS transporter [Actinomadura craniellae]|uniref:MFS transporter n=1 Tax=Actinomadura craniellae TaxID=2231787 RepID=UPI001314ECF9|nr:MFS transporter [Actinomadura craniellae]
MASTTLTTRSWLVVGGSTAALTVSASPLVLQTVGLFMKELGGEFGWSRTEVSGAKSLGGPVAALGVLLFGYLIDRFGLRRVMISAIGPFAGSIALLSLTPDSLLVFYALSILVSLLGAAQQPPAYTKAVASWFDARRGLAIGIAVCGIGLGTSLIPQYTQFLIDHVGWRGAYVGLAVLLLVLALPPWLLVIREPNAQERQQLALAGRVSLTAPGTAAAGEPSGVDRRQALRMRSFWILAVATFVASVSLNGSMTHLIPMLTDLGMTGAAAAAVLIPVGIASLIGRPVAGMLLDRYHGPSVALAQQLLPVVAFLLIGTGASPILGAVFLGLAIGLEVDLASYLTSRYFGLRSFGQIYGVMFAIFVLGASAGGLLFAACYDNFGSYAAAFWICGGALVVTAALFLLLGPYTYPAGRKGRPAGPPSGPPPVPQERSAARSGE